MSVFVRETRVAGATSGPLAGETVAVKANIAIEGEVWDGASPGLQDVVAKSHAPSVQRVLEAGAIIVGQANMHELAFGITSDNAAFGAVESPHGGMAGGSSGGTAAAVAGGLASMGLGTDTGGSGRLPAAFCGCVGFRPTHGRYPSDGVLTLSPTLDTVTPMARSVDDLIRLDAVLAGGSVAEEQRPTTLRLGRVSGPFWSNLDPRVEARVCDTIDRLEAIGFTVETREADLSQAVDAVAIPLVIAETKRWWSAFLQEHLNTDIAGFAAKIASPDVAATFESVATNETSSEALAALQSQGCGRVAAQLAEAMEGFDALIYPTVPIAAPPLHAETVDLGGAVHPLFPLLTGRSPVASLTGSPAISLPIRGYDARPLGLELLARPGQDATLLNWARHIEAAL